MQDVENDMPKNPKKWLFHVLEKEDTDDERIQVFVTPEKYFKECGFQLDMHSGDALSEVMPEYLEEVTDCTWFLCNNETDITGSKVVSDLTKLGFKQNKEFAELFSDF